MAGWGIDPQIGQAENLVILLTGNLVDLHQDIRAADAMYQSIEVPLPAEAERTAFIQWALEAAAVEMEMTPTELGRATAGLSLVHIENVLLRGRMFGKLTWLLVRDAKREIVASEYKGLLEILDPGYGFEKVGGMNTLKAWFERRVKRPILAGETERAAKGILLVGPPGTGKTYFVTAAAKEVGFNAVVLKQQNLLSKWQGQSERDTARALAAIQSLAPVMVFMDEIDAAEGVSRDEQGGSPSGKNMLNQMLTFLNEPANRGRVIFFAATNRPDKLDAALIRSGRIDAIIPVLLPEPEDRALILKAQAQVQGTKLSQDALDVMVQGTDQFSSADLAALLRIAIEYAEDQKHRSILGDDARDALDDLRPSSTRQATYFTNLAIQACNRTSLLPPQYRKLLDNRAALAEQIEAQEPAEEVRRGKREL